MFEVWIKILNTPDIVDALYGVIGVLAGLLFLYLVKSLGLIRYPIKISWLSN